ncbi:MAG: S-adenosylmethionine decarboxylase, partial [Patescibacteria group bacterium]|nr:S-adenosylmethionine decarboxylase [Patescibacteria group bacterium]
MKQKFSKKSVDTANFGMHLMLDAYGSNPEPLNDMRTVFRFLDELPAKIGMHKLAAPFVVDAKETATGKDPGGVTGFVLIAESHISIHTFPK